MTSICALLLLVGAGDAEASTIRVGSKTFTESKILGEVAVKLAEHEGFRTSHKSFMGTGLVFGALEAGDIDIYPDYTGTIAVTLQDPSQTSVKDLKQSLEKKGLRMTGPLGFENSYDIGVSAKLAHELNLKTISDLKQHPDLTFGFSSEFLSRADGWPGLQRAYQLPQTEIRGMEHALAYRALDSGARDIMDVYTTDANIKHFDVVVLEDDLQYFPPYEAVFVYRAELETSAPEFVESLKMLEGQISTDDMIQLNSLVTVEDLPENFVANNLIAEKFSIGTVLPPPTPAERRAAMFRRIGRATWEHLILVIVSLTLAIAVAVPLGVVAAKQPTMGQVILGATEIIQTIPALALLIMLLGPLAMLGINTVGPIPAIIALFLYSLLPIMRNTQAGILGIPGATRESAAALGLPHLAQLRLIELPLASQMILAGIKTTAVINVGYATLGGLIGAGGYGELILTGLNLSSVPKMLEGAIPAAIMAIIVKYLFEAAERMIVPKGLRLRTKH
jgi:osmoprotectant transport system permease protein